MFDKYQVELTLVRDCLGTNPLDPHIMDTHILDRQRKLISEKSKTNSVVNKYLDQIQISKEKGEGEVNKIIDSLEKIVGKEFSPEEREAALKGELESLRETFAELDIKGSTIFMWDKKTNKPCIGDHMIYGFLKAASEAIGRTMPKSKGEALGSISYTQSLINQHVRCEMQFIPFDNDIKREENGDPWYLQRSLRAKTAQGPRITIAKSEVVEAGAKLKFVMRVMKNSALTQKVLDQLFSYGQMVGLGQWRNAGWGLFDYQLTKLS